MVDRINEGEVREKITMPSKFSFGAGIGEDLKWFAGAEFAMQGKNTMSNRFDNVTNAGFKNSYRISAGGYFIPNFNSFNSYFSRITYRAGIRYENTGLVVQGQDINDLGLNLGVGLPISPLGSNLNIGVEAGKRGTTNMGLVQENYISLFVSLSFNDIWFTKRRYD